MPKKALVVFQPSGKKGKFSLGTPVLDCARQLGVDIDSVCGGKGICGRCQVSPIYGSFTKFNIVSSNKSLTPLSSPELKFIKRQKLINDRRLSCHSKITGDVIIDVPAESQIHKQIIRKRPEARIIKMVPPVRIYYLDVKKPTIDNPFGDFERLLKALNEQWGISSVTKIDLKPLQNLQILLREKNWKITVAVYCNEKIISIWSGLYQKIYGVSIDIGTTTIAAHLCDFTTGRVLAADGIMNPQIRFGEDLMSRVAYIMMNPKKTKELVQAVRKGLNNLIKKLRLECKVKKYDVLHATVVCNPIMHHLFIGINPIELGTAPFALAINNNITLQAKELQISSMADNAPFYFLPCIAGHVGADTSAVIVSEMPHLSKEMTLIIDVGTNAEIILGNKDRLLTASSPTGPAFEGAEISCGQRAAPGAIEHFRLNPLTLEPSFQVIGSNLWSDQDGFENSIKKTGVTGICGSGIIEILSEMYLVGLLESDGLISGKQLKKCDRIQNDGRTLHYLIYSGKIEIVVTQNDIRAIQLAKAALYAGVRLLMDKMNTETIDRIVLAGAFGSHIDGKYAMILGMIPDCDIAKVSSAGNAAGTGARITLLNMDSRKEIEKIVRGIEKVETAVEPMFQKHFIEAMSIPHKTALMTNLKKLIKLPNQQISQSRRSRKRRETRKLNN